jgi:hypothetical protein
MNDLIKTMCKNFPDSDFWEKETAKIVNSFLSDDSKVYAVAEGVKYEDDEPRVKGQLLRVDVYYYYFNNIHDTPCGHKIFYLKKVRDDKVIGFLVSKLNLSPSKEDCITYKSYGFNQEDQKWKRLKK